MEDKELTETPELSLEEVFSKEFEKAVAEGDQHISDPYQQRWWRNSLGNNAENRR